MRSMIGAVLALCFVAVANAATTSPIYPNAKLTPGAVMTTSANVVCHRLTSTVRDVQQSEKNAVYREYGITHHPTGEYQIDHLIALTDGGSNAITNLWPQSYLTKPWNAHVKDRLENRLHKLVCNGTLSLPTAQHLISTDWIAAYKKYVGATP